MESMQNISNEPAGTPPVSDNPQKSNSFLLIVIGLVLISVVGVGGVLLGKYLYAPKETPSQPVVSIPTRVPTAIPTTDLTANWKIYTNSVKGYSIKYPEKWNLQTTVFYDENNQKIGEFSPGLVTPKNAITCEEYLNRVINGGAVIETSEISLSFGGQKPKLIEQKKVDINGKTWNLQIQEVNYEGGSPAYTGKWYPQLYCLNENNKMFLINFYEQNQSPKNTEIFHQILSTFKFL